MTAVNNTAELPACFAEYGHVKRYWSPERKSYIAKVMPGECYVSCADNELIATGLGSCVAACIWDPLVSLGGMNHFMLPECSDTERRCGDLSARYGFQAMELLINGLLSHGAERRRLQVKLFGGGNVLEQAMDIGQRNIAFVREYVACEQLTVCAEDLGGRVARQVLFSPVNGRAWLKRRGIQTPTATQEREVERRYQATLLQQAQTAEDHAAELF